MSSFMHLMMKYAIFLLVICSMYIFHTYKGFMIYYVYGLTRKALPCKCRFCVSGARMLLMLRLASLLFASYTFVLLISAHYGRQNGDRDFIVPLRSVNIKML